MCEKDALLAYLYDDLSGADRVAFETHLQECAACHDELKALGAVRVDLASWAPPHVDLDFRVVRGASQTGHVLRTPVLSWRAWYTPAAGLAAAAVLVLAAASAVARVEVHRGPDGVTVRTGWSAGAPAGFSGSFGETSPAAAGATGARGGGTTVATTTAAAPAQNVRLASSSPSAATPADAAFVAELDRRLSALESSSRASGVRQASTLTARAADAEIIRRVRELVTQSESRQKGELAFRIAQVLRDVDAQRVADLSRIQQGLGRIDATVTAEAASHRDLTNFILTSAKQK